MRRRESRWTTGTAGRDNWDGGTGQLGRRDGGLELKQRELNAGREGGNDSRWPEMESSASEGHCRSLGEGWAVDSRGWTVASKRRVEDSGQWATDGGQWTVDSGRRMVDVGQWIVKCGRWMVDDEWWTVSGG